MLIVRIFHNSIVQDFFIKFNLLFDNKYSVEIDF